MSAVGGAQVREVNSTSCRGGPTSVLSCLPSEIKEFHESSAAQLTKRLKTFGKGK